MDLFQTARYFDRQRFQQYDFSANSWGDTFIEGQLKKADLFQTIYHRPTRKRMLYCAPGQEPSSPVIRLETTGQEFMVGALQQDSHQNVHYRNVYALHCPAGMAQIIRRAPSGPANNPGWGTDTVIETTFVDLELRSANEDEDAIPSRQSHYFLTLPSNCRVNRYDVIMYQDLPYFVLERYVDSSLILCRTAQHIDPRENFVYNQIGADTYVGGRVTKVSTPYNITARVGPADEKELIGSIAQKILKVKIQEGWIGFQPKLKDTITIYGTEYEVVRVIRDPTEQEWNLLVQF